MLLVTVTWYDIWADALPSPAIKARDAANAVNPEKYFMLVVPLYAKRSGR